MVTESAPRTVPAKHNPHHGVPLATLFIALLVLTAGEVAIFEIWSHIPFVPKYVMVLMLLILTLPKAAIVMIYFMHLKFEKQFVVLLAVAPLVLVLLAVLPTLSDAMTLKNRGQAMNQVRGLNEWVPAHGHGSGGHGTSQGVEPAGEAGH
jgi:hypothetical protein